MIMTETAVMAFAVIIPKWFGKVRLRLAVVWRSAMTKLRSGYASITRAGIWLVNAHIPRKMKLVRRFLNFKLF